MNPSPPHDFHLNSTTYYTKARLDDVLWYCVHTTCNEVKSCFEIEFQKTMRCIHFHVQHNKLAKMRNVMYLLVHWLCDFLRLVCKSAIWYFYVLNEYPLISYEGPTSYTCADERARDRAHAMENLLVKTKTKRQELLLLLLCFRFYLPSVLYHAIRIITKWHTYSRCRQFRVRLLLLEWA